jgi:heterodisulfide reductase subunit B
MGQIVLARKTKDKKKIPTFYLTQLVGLALGFSPKDLGLDVHRIKSKKLLASIDVA